MTQLFAPSNLSSKDRCPTWTRITKRAFPTCWVQDLWIETVAVPSASAYRDHQEWENNRSCTWTYISNRFCKNVPHWRLALGLWEYMSLEILASGFRKGWVNSDDVWSGWWAKFSFCLNSMLFERYIWKINEMREGTTLLINEANQAQGLRRTTGKLNWNAGLMQSVRLPWMSVDEESRSRAVCGGKWLFFPSL